MKRMAALVSVLACAVLILGVVEDLTNFRWAAGDQNTFFGNPRLLLNDGKVVLILSGLLVLASAAMWYVALRKGQSDQREP